MDFTKAAEREKETGMGASEEESAGGIAALHVLISFLISSI
jgi:hypothetical protein